MEELLENLEQVFKQLRVRTVEPELDKDAKLRSFVGKPKGSGASGSSAAMSSSSAEGLSLFDFVDEDSVNTLKTQTHQEMQKLTGIVMACHAMASSLVDSLVAIHNSYVSIQEGVDPSGYCDSFTSFWLFFSFARLMFLFCCFWCCFGRRGHLSGPDHQTKWY